MKVFQLKLKELESKKTKDRKWLCRKCSKYTKPFTLAGMGLTCADCGKYAYGYYEVGRKIEPAIIFRVDN